ncbi:MULTISPECIES: sensor histidine kinase [unclassified Paenibacillus]|uniref:sensor histidine kinase n=1 Tax=unclassified Paenibacillus TaxID=185978 RepID=UPI002406019F|nr:MULTISPECIES: sensor histidine kinase [unclassified Paenibacillus]MDF9845321.1 two-component system sensor histidine kinase AgrC [Paenibacillus sp. PastF-2]MDF9851903.1 two-component system sensor histidine kinase AgrC [Paenibacillus sp. PastM-2]MDF9858483.1 two-component system sensor histidine kinase AgrC [Paenibacillus sp. PastF-1]MDH6483733.1 two-component system sensor histidine kinase AgrC [Paenibacillus sp. PastH-2]MDH6511132.1 two-component system sensor histidine kinase AgrC [Paeni
MEVFLIEEVFYIITLIAIPFLIHYFYTKTFKYYLVKQKSLLFSYSLYYVFIVVLHHSEFTTIWILTINFLLIILLAFLYTGTFVWKISMACFVIVFIVLADLALAPVFSTIQYILALFFSKILIFILMKVILKLVILVGEGSLSKRYWVMLFACPISSMIVVIYLLLDSSYRSYPQLYPVLSFSLLIINLLVMVLCDRILRIQTEQAKTQLLEQQNTYYIHQFLMTKNRQEEVLKFKHDFKNILIGLRSQLQMEKETASVKQLDELLGTISTNTEYCNTGSIIIDSIINYKYTVASKLNITMEFDIQIPHHLQLDSVTMSIILGNILDNAIEACIKVADRERYIKVSIYYLNESLYIQITNPYAHSIKINHNGELISTKHDNQHHGLGVKNIITQVEQKEGIWNIDYSNQIFKIEVVLYNIPVHSSSAETNTATH